VFERGVDGPPGLPEFGQPLVDPVPCRLQPPPLGAHVASPPWCARNASATSSRVMPRP
jgi:hypothetical protein